MIRRRVDALDDRNPVYLDAEFPAPQCESCARGRLPLARGGGFL